MAAKEIRARLTALRKEMKARKCRTISCFNAGLTPEEYYYNSQLFMLKVQLEQAIKEESR